MAHMMKHVFLTYLYVSGEAAAWRFLKYHIILHLIYHLVRLGWAENFSAQSGEHNHKFCLKLLKHLTNNKDDWEKQVFNIHTREQTLQHIIGAVSKCSCNQYCVCVLCVLQCANEKGMF